MIATYVDQVVAEERLADISREAIRIQMQNQRPLTQPTATHADADRTWEPTKAFETKTSADSSEIAA